jgi:lipopolysaccharide/colanic/teichoic acid biosynthesis glycosyltransferase
LTRTLRDGSIRLLDITLSILLLCLLMPVFCLIALYIGLDSSGPVILSQDRVGHENKRFRMYKFRTMRPAGGPQAPEYRHSSQGRIEPVVKKKEDDRVTRAGRILRKYSLDELPQLMNIVKGEMTLVGPRPVIPEEAEMYDERQKERLAGKPGLTGLAQISGRSELDFERIVSLDKYYLAHRSVRLYLKIAILTIPFFLSGKSSY